MPTVVHGLNLTAVGAHPQRHANVGPEQDHYDLIKLKSDLDPVTGALVRELRDAEGTTMLDLAVAKLGERTVLASVSPSGLHTWDLTTGQRMGTAELGQDWAELCEEWESGWLPDRFAPPLLVRVREAGVVVVQLAERTFDEDRRDVVYLELDNLDDKTIGEEFDDGRGPLTMTAHAGQAVLLVANRTEPSEAWEPPANAVVTHSDHETDVDLDADTRLITAAAFGSLEGRLCLATAGLDGTVQLWDARHGGAVGRQLPVPPGRPRGVRPAGQFRRRRRHRRKLHVYGQSRYGRVLAWRVNAR